MSQATSAAAVERKAPRLLIGPDARGAEFVQRLMPGRYWSLMQRVMGDMKKYIGKPGEA